MITVKRDTDWSLSDVIGMENQITCYKAQMLPKLKLIGKLIEEICSPSSPRLEPVKLKPNRLYLVTTDLEKSFEFKVYSRRKGELKEHLDKIHFLNECHCSRTPCMAETCWKLALGSVKEKSLTIVLPGLTSGAGLVLQIASHTPTLQRL